MRLEYVADDYLHLRFVRVSQRVFGQTYMYAFAITDEMSASPGGRRYLATELRHARTQVRATINRTVRRWCRAQRRSMS